MSSDVSISIKSPTKVVSNATASNTSPLLVNKIVKNFTLNRKLVEEKIQSPHSIEPLVADAAVKRIIPIDDLNILNQKIDVLKSYHGTQRSEIDIVSNDESPDSASFDKNSTQTCEGSKNLEFEEAAQAQKSTVSVGEKLGGGASTGVEEEGVATSTGVGEEVGGVSTSVGEEVGGASTTTASDVPLIGFDWEGASENSEDSGYENLFDEIDNDYRSDVHEEVRTLREDEDARFEIDTDIDADVEDEVQQPTRSGKR
ncbi:hypothetical protein FXO37_33304 [Capsicum annuum]|nr:hypothetical protein FXO37_33304 [Capsicum annuum]